MNFKTVSEAFNFYKNHSTEQIDARIAEIRSQIEKDENVDIRSLNIELTGLDEAKRNIAEKRSSGIEERSGLQFREGMNRTGNEVTFTPETVLDSKEYRSAFMKNMIGIKMNEIESKAWKEGLKVAEKRSDDFTNASDAVAVLPTETLNEIIKGSQTVGGLLYEARAFAVPAKIAIPVANKQNKASWHVEGAEVDPDLVVPTSVTFDSNELIKLFSISAKVRTMSIPAFESYLIEELRHSVLEAIADSLVNGDGEGEGMGLLNGITWRTSGTGQNVLTSRYAGNYIYEDVVSAVGMVPANYADGIKFAMSRATLYKQFYGMTDSNGRPIFIADPRNETIGRILGLDIVIDDGIPADVVLLGNFKRYLGYNLPDGIIVETSRESSFRRGLIDYRALAIADTQVIVPGAFVKMVLGSTPAPTTGD